MGEAMIVTKVKRLKPALIHKCTNFVGKVSACYWLTIDPAFFIFLGCSDYIRFNRWSPNNLLSKVVNLSVANSEKFDSSSRDNCSVISGHFFDYNGFHSEWKSIHDQIFGFHQLKLQVQHWFFSLIFIPFCDIYRHFPELSI